MVSRWPHAASSLPCTVVAWAGTLQRLNLNLSPHLMDRWLYWGESRVCPFVLRCLGNGTVCVAFQRAILKTAAQNQYFGCILRCSCGGDFH